MIILDNAQFDRLAVGATLPLEGRALPVVSLAPVLDTRNAVGEARTMRYVTVKAADGAKLTVPILRKSPRPVHG
jgi:hypothetical protein